MSANFARNEILSVWNTSNFKELLYQRTLHAILQANDIQVAWDSYLKWIRIKYPKTSKEIDKVNTQAVKNQIKSHIENREYKELKTYLLTTFIQNKDILASARIELSERVSFFYNDMSLGRKAITFFRVSTQDLLVDLKNNLDSNKQNYELDEITFLGTVILEIFCSKIPVQFERVLTANSLKWEEVEKEARIEARDLFTDIINLMNDKSIVLDNDESINTILTTLIKETLDLISVIEKATVERRIQKLRDCARKLARGISDIKKDPALIGIQNVGGSVVSTPTPPSPTPPPSVSPSVPSPSPEPIKTTPPAADLPQSPSPAEIANKELKTLRDEISKLPLNDSEKTALTNATDKTEAEAVRTQHNARIQREQEEKTETTKYAKLLSDITSETDLTKLEDGKEYDLAITNLKTELLPSDQQPATLTLERQKKLKELQEQKQRTEETAKAQQLLTEINSTTDLSQLPDDTTIQGKYIATLLDANYQYSELIKVRDNKRTELLTAQTLISYNNLLDGINNSLDPAKLATDEEIKKAYDETLLGDTYKYEGVIKIRDSKRQELLTNIELGKYQALLAEIDDPQKNTFITLPNNFKQSEISELNNDLLPADKKKETLTARIKERRSGFVYKLNVLDNEVEGDGLTQAEVDSAFLKEQEKWQTTVYKPPTNEQLNKLVALEFPDGQPVPPERMNEPEADLTKWLKETQGGYKIDEDLNKYDIHGTEYTGKEVWDNEEKWIADGERDKQGTLFLPYLYKRFGFDPDKLRIDGELNPDYFCKIDEKRTKSGNVIEVISTEQGVWPFPTASGKSTKFTYELVNGGKENVILVAPTAGLAEDARNHHTGWLRKNEETGQPWNCVYHGKPHGEYKVALNDLTYYYNKNKKEYQGEKGLSILEGWALSVFLNRELVNAEYGKDLKEASKDAMAKLAKAGKLNPDYEANVRAIKDRLISKKETILLFDEAHEPNPEYQVLQLLAIKLGYKVMIMTATVKGGKIPFSITTSYPRTITRINKLNFTDEELANSKFLFFFKNARLTPEQRAILEDPDNPVFNTVFDETNMGISTGITQYAPNGSVFISDRRMSMGFSPWIHKVVILNRMETVSLGKYAMGKDGKPFLLGRWDYGEPEEQALPKADLVQEAGRAARLMSGDVYVFNNFKRNEQGEDEPEELDMSKKRDLASKMLTAALTGDTSKIKAIQANLGDVNFLRAALALPYKWGLTTAEILIGLGGYPNYPTFGNEPDKPYSEKLWKAHMGIKEPVVMNVEQAKQVLLLSVQAALHKQSDVGNGVSCDLESPLIKTVGWKVGDVKAIEELRTVLNKVIDEKVGNKIEFSEAERQKFLNSVAWRKLSNDIKITIEQEYKDEAKKKPKSNLTIKFEYSKPTSTPPLDLPLEQSKGYEVPTMSSEAKKK